MRQSYEKMFLHSNKVGTSKGLLTNKNHFKRLLS